MKITDITKQNALEKLLAAGFAAVITRDGLDVVGQGWSVHYDDRGQGWNTYEGTVPTLVEELAVWDDNTTRQAGELNINHIWNKPVNEVAATRLSGRNRISGESIETTPAALLADAMNRDGHFGPCNEPVSTCMSLAALTNWHSDYDWTIQP